ncbi:MAG: Holliday junction branch migration protein RuvA [Bacteroidetes bacterium]|nr:Holliday junction branch migration protein RuvA [Bacteroidota bacterium]MBU1422201.1 Holliday junction branch migration protein RuvA [Bacteroidota bacterium]MBU2471257.1 Holliday junction branch migration protein RuvA [Bacteroidota bacterium]MBU2636611.1 Holliday junction branch migration protein RuvA [Bacteroidota bacterium]
MYSYLQGKLVSKSPTEVVLDVNGVGYFLNISLSTYEKLDSSSSQIKIFTYLHVREDALQLFGFATEAERDMFKMLISVSGIGPKIAQGILSGINTEELRTAFQTGNIATLTSIPGIGRKTAERLVLELRDKLGKIDIEISTLPTSSQQLKIRNDALNALLSLGYNRTTAERAIRQVLKDTDNKELTLEVLIKQALHHTSK